MGVDEDRLRPAALRQASTRPGPEAGMGGPAAKSRPRTTTTPQRGPARRPGWADPPKTTAVPPLPLQRGPARRPGWAALPVGHSRAGLARFNEARPGGRDGRLQGHPARAPGADASTRPGPEAGMGGEGPDHLPPPRDLLQRGPARRPGWADMGRSYPRTCLTCFNEARPGGRDGRRWRRTGCCSTRRFNEARPGGRDGREELLEAVSRFEVLQRGPARRPGWAARGRSPPPRTPMLQRGPARRPGWALAGKPLGGDDSNALQRGPARRPGWATSDQSGTGSAEALQRGPARRPGWARV